MNRRSFLGALFALPFVRPSIPPRPNALWIVNPYVCALKRLELEIRHQRILALFAQFERAQAANRVALEEAR